MTVEFWMLMIGAIVSVAAGVALAALLLWFAGYALWGQLKLTYSFPWLFRAIRHYHKVEPSPLSSRVPDRQEAQD